MHKNEIAVKVEHLTKSFQIPLEAHSGIKQKLINTIKGHKGYREFTPLDDVSFVVERGDFFGIVGKNGSGKSTLLKTLAGIYNPDGGQVHVNGTLVPFIELGVGFNPELTGRENVFLNGALLGFSHTQMQEMYDDIVDFAELHDFMEERLKNYSSGMQVRLAFSIAIRADGDVLLLDEVLAVGDEAFQRKCYEYFDKLKRNKKTVILVTHDMASVERFCNKALMLENGEIKINDRPHKVAAAYSRSNIETQQSDEDLNLASSEFSVNILDSNGDLSQEFMHNDQVKVAVSWDTDKVTSVSLTVYKESGERIFWTGTYQNGFHMDGDQKSVNAFFNANLSEGRYFIAVSLWKENLSGAYASIAEGPSFRIYRNPDDERWEGLTNLPHTWENE